MTDESENWKTQFAIVREETIENLAAEITAIIYAEMEKAKHLRGKNGD